MIKLKRNISLTHIYNNTEKWVNIDILRYNCYMYALKYYLFREFTGHINNAYLANPRFTDESVNITNRNYCLPNTILDSIIFDINNIDGLYIDKIYKNKVPDLQHDDTYIILIFADNNYYHIIRYYYNVFSHKDGYHGYKRGLPKKYVFKMLNNMEWYTIPYVGAIKLIDERR